MTPTPTQTLIHNLPISTYHRLTGPDLILFLPGLGCTKDSFLSAFNEPTLAAFSLLAPDYVGFGDSAKPENWDYSLESQSSILSDLIEAHSHKRLHIVAHSFGGAVALVLPPDLLQRLASFTNIEGNLLPGDCGLVSRRTASATFEQFQTSILPMLKTDMPSGPGYFELDRTEPVAFFESAKSLVAWSDSRVLIERFKSLRCPRLYVYGEQSDVSYVLKEISDIPVLKGPSCGHFVTGDNPGWFFAELGKFLTDSAVGA